MWRYVLDMPSYVDIHTHAFPVEGGSAHRIFRAFHQEEQQALAGYAGECSVGLHPWFLSPGNMQAQWSWLEAALDLPNVRMLGEAGLDLLRGPELEFQQFCFEKQLRWASEKGKPVVIHCVRAFEALKTCVKEAEPKVPLILHGFNRSEKVLASLLPMGYLFSFGAALCREGHPVSQTIRSVPRDRLFLETDDSGLAIEVIYEKAAEILALPLKELKEQVWENSIKIGIL